MCTALNLSYERRFFLGLLVVWFWFFIRVLSCIECLQYTKGSLSKLIGKDLRILTKELLESIQWSGDRSVFVTRLIFLLCPVCSMSIFDSIPIFQSIALLAGGSPLKSPTLELLDVLQFPLFSPEAITLEEGRVENYFALSTASLAPPISTRPSKISSFNAAWSTFPTPGSCFMWRSEACRAPWWSIFRRHPRIGCGTALSRVRNWYSPPGPRLERKNWRWTGWPSG